MVHIFVYVVRAGQDPFFGIKQALVDERNARLVEVRFSPSELDCIDTVEYTKRRFVRVFYYLKIFASLQARLNAVLQTLNGEYANVYFSDEGVWAVLWQQIRRSYPRDQVRGVNVQHGFAELKLARFGAVRRMINYISRLLSGYPSLGMGSLAGAGADAFDVYLTYDEKAADFIRKRTGNTALPCPYLIKAELITSFRQLATIPQKGTQRALFAMNMKMRGSPIKCDAVETFDQLLPLAKALNQRGLKLVIRLHPGMDRFTESARFLNHHIANWAELDADISLHASMKQAVIVMSFFSTVLWEAGLLGLMPVQVVCKCCNSARLEFDRHVLLLDSELEASLLSLIMHLKEWEGTEVSQSIALDWEQARTHLCSRGHSDHLPA